MSARRSFLVAAIIGITVSLMVNGSKLALTDYRPEADEWLAYALMAAFPFAVLGALGFRRRADWLVALMLTIGAWGAYLVLGIPQLASAGSIDMGLGFLAATSPAWIAIAVVLGGWAARAFARKS